MRHAIFGIVACAIFVFTQPVAAQIPARGLSALLCAADINGDGAYYVGPSGNLVIVVTGDNGSSATVEITHGNDGSTHYVEYVDNGDSSISCGDQIVNVS